MGLIKDIQKLLESQQLTLGDVVMMHVYLGGDPAKDGKMDFAGMMAGYTQFFGTKDQPNKPARTTVQVVLPAGARGGLVEIDLIAVRSKQQAGPHFLASLAVGRHAFARGASRNAAVWRLRLEKCAEHRRPPTFEVAVTLESAL